MATTHNSRTNNRLFPNVLFALVLFIALPAMIFAGGATERTPSGEVLVTPEWIADFKGDITILDTARSQEDYLAGHIPGAIQVERQLVWDTVNGLAGMLPSAESVAADLAELGVSNDKPVVVYDSGNGLWAARFFWALEYIGHSNVHLLDGGYAGWTASGNDVSTDITIPERGTLAIDIQDELIASQEYILNNLENENVVIIDTRSEGEFSGTDVRAERGGRIPGSVNIEWTQNLGDEGSFKTLPELQGMYDLVLDSSDQEAITLCQTGVRGAHTYVALRVAGYQNVRLYDGSWAQWGNNPEAPIDL